jgi:hypothetical protein
MAVIISGIYIGVFGMNKDSTSSITNFTTRENIKKQADSISSVVMACYGQNGDSGSETPGNVYNTANSTLYGSKKMPLNPYYFTKETNAVLKQNLVRNLKCPINGTTDDYWVLLYGGIDGTLLPPAPNGFGDWQYNNYSYLDNSSTKRVFVSEIQLLAINNSTAYHDVLQSLYTKYYTNYNQAGTVITDGSSSTTTTNIYSNFSTGSFSNTNGYPAYSFGTYVFPNGITNRSALLITDASGKNIGIRILIYRNII